MHPRNYDADCRATVFSTSAHPNPDGFAQPKTGLGTGVVKALSRQLDAQVRRFGNKSFGYSRDVCGRVIYAGDSFDLTSWPAAPARPQCTIFAK
jgi:hypothetical protein